LLDRQFAATPISTRNIACKPLPYIFAPLGLLTLIESEQIVAAMRERDLPVRFLVYSDEGHGLVRPENRLSFLAMEEAFYAEHLGGRCEPVGNDLAGSSLVAGPFSSAVAAWA